MCVREDEESNATPSLCEETRVDVRWGRSITAGRCCRCQVIVYARCDVCAHIAGSFHLSAVYDRWAV